MNLFTVKDTLDPVKFHQHLIRFPVITSSKREGMKPEVIISGHKIFVCGFNIRSPFVSALHFRKSHLEVRRKYTLLVYQATGDCEFPATTLEEEFYFQ